MSVNVVLTFCSIPLQILFLFGVLIVLALASTIANKVWTSWHVNKDWYLAYQGVHLSVEHFSGGQLSGGQLSGGHLSVGGWGWGISVGVF